MGTNNTGREGNLAKIEEYLHEIEPNLHEDPWAWRASVIVLACDQLGIDVVGLQEMTGYDRREIEGMIENLRNSGCVHFTGEKLAVYLVNEDGGLRDETEFWATVMVAQGLVTAQRNENGELAYRTTQAGSEAVGRLTGSA